MPDLERRFTSHKVEMRRGEGDAPATITGLAAVFDSRSKDLGGFTEIIAPGAFDDVLKQDTRALFNHDSNIVLGRQGAGTLELDITPEGLRYVATPPDTQLVRDMVLTPMERGDVDQSSFGFFIASDGDEWRESKGMVTRTITKVERLLDVSPVTFPAYPDATSAVQRMQEFRKLLTEAPPADEIELAELRAEIERLRAAMRRLTDFIKRA